METKVYYEEDADRSFLKDKRISIIGYGSQGRGQALNLRDSGYEVIIGLRTNSPSAEEARKNDLQVESIEKAATIGDIIQVLIPDTVQPDVYDNHIAPNLNEDDTLMFSHGFNIHFNQIIPPDNVNVAMVAPKGPGHIVRRLFKNGQGVPCLIAVEHDFSGDTKELALAYSDAIGGTRSGVLETTFKEETETDLFGEQAVLCGGVTELIKAGFETLTDNGYQPEIAYFEVLNELKLIVDLIYESGISGMRDSVSDTAEYGDLTRGPRIINESTRTKMKEILKEIKSGDFAHEWIMENKANRPKYSALRAKDQNHEIEEVGQKLRQALAALPEE